MRFIVQYMKKADFDDGKKCYLLSYSAEIAETRGQAMAQFEAKHPDKMALGADQVTNEKDAFERYGEGAWTDEERAAYREQLNQRYKEWGGEHDQARRRVEGYSLEEFAAELEYMQRRASESTSNAEGVHAGDIFVACWGYDQTNYDFYQVVTVKGKHTVIVQENACNAEMCSDYNGYKRPIRDHFRDETRYTLRTSFDDYHKCPKMRVPGLSGYHYMNPAEFGRLYSHSTGA